jgi:hypothetical protein
MTDPESAPVAPRRFTPKIVGGTAHASVPLWKRKWTSRLSREGEDPIFAAIENHRLAVAAKLECYAEADRLQEKHGKSFDWDTYTDGPYNDVWTAAENLVVTVPTTVPGLMAMLIYAHDLVPENDRRFWTESGLTGTLIETLATTAKALIGRQA